MSAVIDHARHTPYSDPGRFAALVSALPVDPAALSAVSRNVIVHYRASGHELPDATRDEINARWVDRILAADQERHPWPLDRPREVTSRVQGCCRDHTLLCIAALRTHGIPARSRVGFAGYFVDGWHHDHVVVEAWLDGRWRRFDSEVEAPLQRLLSPTDIPSDSAEGCGFVTASQVWAAYRGGDLDPDTYGVDPDIPGLHGPRFVFDEVIYEVAHRFGDELLLWDGWGRMGELDAPVSEEDAAWVDEVAALLLAADEGDLEAEHRLLARYRADDGLHPGPTIIQASPFGADPVHVSLRA
jgi:transglutaminase superfamily protein